MAEMDLGHFAGDEQLQKNGARLLRRVAHRQTVCLRKLAERSGPEKVKFRRFLMNERVTVAER